MQRLLHLARWIDALNNFIGRLTYWLVLVMVGVGVWNVLGRYLGYFVGRNFSSNALIEVQWYLFDLVFLLGAAYTLRHNDHVRVDVLQARWGTRRKVIADLVGTVLFLLPFCVMVIWVSWHAIATSWALRETSPDPGGLPRYPIKAMILVSFGLLILQGLSEAIKQVAFLRGQNSSGGQP